MDRATWESMNEDEKKAWNSTSEKSKIRIAGFHFGEGKECVSRGSEADKMQAKERDLVFDNDDDEGELEAKQHDLVFDDDTDEEEDIVEVNVNEAEPTNAFNTESARKMCEDEGVDFDMILSVQRANTKIQASTRQMEFGHNSNDSSDEENESHAIEARAHAFGEMLDFDL